MIIWTWATIGWDAAWKLGAMVAAAGIADVLVGWGRRLTLSEEVNKKWHSDPLRYLVWIIGMALAALALHAHFTGV